MMKVWFDILTRKDARALQRWWSRHGQFRIERSQVNRRFWQLVRF
jgi:hypothetical protein